MNHLKNSEDGFSRRMVLAGAASAVGLSLAKPSLATSFDSVEAVEQRFGGRIGVFAIDTGSGHTISHRADERFLMCSTFKGLLAAQILARVDKRQESLKRLIPYTEKDLIFTSPVTKANVAKGALSVADLCQAMLEESDNTAAILLMRSAGGPKGLTQYLRSLGDKVTRSDRFEPDSNSYDGELDTTTPKAMAETYRKLLLGDVLSSASRGRLEAGMVACKPGRRRVRAVLPGTWLAGDRPGTSINDETNDVAIVRAPGRAPLIVAAFCHAPHLSLDAREAVLREAGVAFVDWARR
jgi:beta-lactamase class A